MRRELIEYAIEGLKNKKRTTIPAFFVLCISFSFIIFATFLVSSIEKTNNEFRINTYGDWYVDLLDVKQADIDAIQNKSWVSSSGVSCNYGTVSCGDKKVGIGTVDDYLKDIGRLSLSEGVWPQNSNEVVMESDTLCSLGYDYSIGQKIVLDICIQISEEDFVYVEEEYVLVGIVHEYTDLWTINEVDRYHFLNSIIISDEAKEQIENDVNELLSEHMKLVPDIQLFLQVPAQNRVNIEDELSIYTTSYNRCVYEGENGVRTNEVYIVIILVITLIAIMFTYLLQIEKQVQSFSIMRSIGMTKRQLVCLIIYETLILAIPAIIVGIILGSLSMFIVLKVLVYGGSVPITINYVWKSLFLEIIAWTITLLIARLIVYVIVVRAPLLGKMSMQRNKRRIIHIMRHVCITIICMCYGAIVIFTGIMSINPSDRKQFIESCPSYILWPKGEDMFYEAIEKENMSEQDVENICNIPGVDYVYGFSEYNLGKSFLYVINDKDWEEVFQFEKSDINMDEFRRGEKVILCIPKEDRENYKTDFSSIRLSFETINGEEINDVYAEIGGFLYITEDVNCRLVVGFCEPYTVLCTEEFVRKYGIEGYTRIYVNTNISTENTSTDMTIAEYCRKNNIFLSNRREEYQAYKQENLQKLIMLYSVGISAGIIFMLLLGCILALEKEYQERNYIILRTIGMSKSQWRLKCFILSFKRGVISLLGGWIILINILLFREQSFENICGGRSVVVSLIAMLIPTVMSMAIFVSRKE